MTPCRKYSALSWKLRASARPASTVEFNIFSTSFFFSSVALTRPSMTAGMLRSPSVISLAMSSRFSIGGCMPKVCMADSMGGIAAWRASTMEDHRCVSTSKAPITMDSSISMFLSKVLLIFPTRSSLNSLHSSTSSCAFSWSITSVELMREVIPARAAVSKALLTWLVTPATPGTILETTPPMTPPAMPRGFSEASARLVCRLAGPGAP
mmetsp:Transcript_462/g.1521  ORF Transcript_462/g.1521 Transcript_462/m.1521 type:complete len:209 (+) Transcript_462:279-905(+)